MTLEDRFRRWHSPTIFTLIALCFLLPFAAVTSLTSCESGSEPYGQPHNITGIQLVTRTVPQQDKHGYFDSGVEDAGSTSAEIAFAAALVGLLLGIFGIERGPGWCATVGIGALLSLPVAVTISPHNLQWSSLHGWWLAVVLFVWAGILHLIRAREGRPPRLDPPLPPLGP